MPDDGLTKADVDMLCDAASAVYFHLLRFKARETGRPVALPELMCPKGRVRCVCEFDDDAIDDAEQFLLRLGVIGPRKSSDISHIQDL